MTDRRPPAPRYDGEGPHALWHVSEDPTLERLVPHVPASNPDATPAVWAVDTRHVPMFWFPRDCPRGCVWASDRTADDDRERFFGSTDASRLHVVESVWLPSMLAATLYLYRLPEPGFEAHPDVGGYWTTPVPVEPLERAEVGDLLGKHADAGFELRITPSIWPWWKSVVGSTLEYSGSRLGNASEHPDRFGV